MKEQRKHTILRLIISKRHKNIKVNDSNVLLKQAKQIRIVTTPNLHKKQILNIETSASQIQLKKRQQTSLLPKLTSSAQKRINSDKQTYRKNIYTALYITSNSWCLYDSRTKKYQGFRQQYIRQIASLTKIMTTYLSLYLIQHIQIPLDCMVRTTKIASEIGGTTAQLKQRLWVTIQDLLYETILPSGNDAAHSLALYLGYLRYLNNKNRKITIQQIRKSKRIDLTNINTNIFVQEFISQMNEKASKLGLFDTRFSNPHGLQNALNTSSAKDIIKLSQQATKNSLFTKIMNTFYHKYRFFDGDRNKYLQTRKWWNTNKLLLKGQSGIKTGFTTVAGGCLCSLKQGIFITVLNSQSAQSRFFDTEKIFNWYAQQSLGQRNDLKMSGVEIFCEAYSENHQRSLPSVLTEVFL